MEEAVRLVAHIVGDKAKLLVVRDLAIARKLLATAAD